MSSEIRDQLQATLSGSYTLERELGGGGMSRVFLADEIRLKRKVVVKVLSPELAQGVSAERFEREIQTAASLQQANIVPVLAVGESAGLPYYTMPFVDGESLRARLGRGGPIAVPEAIGILRDVARALAYAHAHGIVHRDIKPDNVLLSGGAAVVTDFGIAKAISASRTQAGAAAPTLTQLGTSIGTPAYISPEQAAGDANVDARADIYSFGCMAYELLAGRPPFVAKTPQRLLAAHLSERPQQLAELRPDLPVTLSTLIMKCLEKEADARPESAEELLTSLEAATTGDGGQRAMPNILLGGRGMLKRALALYAIAFVIVAIVAKAAIVGIGLPDWVFPGSLIVMALGLPAILFTAYAQYVARKAMTASPTFTPGGTPSLVAPGTMATIAMKASPHVSWRRTTAWGAYAFGAFVLLVGGFMLLRALGIGPAGSLMAAGKLGQRERVTLAEFKGPPSDSLLGPTVTEAFRTDIGQSANLQVMPATAMREVLRRMQRPANTRIDFPVAREIATREGLKAVIDGEVVALGGSYVLSVRLVAAESGEELAAFRETAETAKDIIPAISRLSKSLRARVGESLRRVQNARSLEKVSTPSLEALKEYVQSIRASEVDGDFEKARSLLDEAIAIDTGFAMAYRYYAVILGNAGLDRPKQLALIQKAYDHRDRLTDAERYNTVAYYFLYGPKHDLTKAIGAYEALVDLDSNNLAGLNNLGTMYLTRRELPNAEKLFRRVIALDPTTSVAYQNLILAELRLGKVDDAEQTAQLMNKALPRNPRAANVRAGLALQRGDYDTAVAIADSVRAARPNDNSTQIGELRTLSFVAALQGQLAESVRLMAEARRRAGTAGNRQAALNAALDEPEMDLWYRDDEARGLRGIARALAEHPIDSIPVDTRPYQRLSQLYSLAGRADLVQSTWEARKRSGQTARMDATELEAETHQVKALMAMAEQHYGEAAQEFRAGDYGECIVCILPEIARAYDLAGQSDSAIAIFNRYVTSAERDLATDSRQLAGAHKRLGELYEAKGDRDSAVQHYAKFVDLWKKADPELQPKVAEVRKRLARLSDTERR